MTLADLFADPVRIVRNTDTVLEIENRPTRRTAITVGAILLAAAMGLAALADGATGTGIIVLWVTALIGGLILRETAVVTQLRLDRGTGQVRLRTSGLRGREEKSAPLHPTLRVEHRTRYGSTAGTDKAELVLVTAGDGSRHEFEIPIGRADGADVREMATAITGWLAHAPEDRP